MWKIRSDLDLLQCNTLGFIFQGRTKAVPNHSSSKKMSYQPSEQARDTVQEAQGRNWGKSL